MFRDGGILVFGINVFNMVVVILLVIVFVDSFLKMVNFKNEKVRMFISIYILINAAVFLIVVEFGF